MNKIKKLSLILLLFAFLNMAFAPAARADAWGSNMGSTIYQITTERMIKSIQETILANLKMAALRIIQTRLLSLLGGAGGPSAPGVTGYIISDWKMFIYNSATRYSDQVTTDFFRNVNAGATSAMRQYVTGPAQSAVNVDYWNMRPDLQYYCPGGDPTKAFDAGTSNQWKCWQMSGAPQNDLAFTVLREQSFKEAAYQQEAQAKISEGQSGQGYASKERKLTIPGSKDREVTTSSGAKVSAPAISDYKGQNIGTPGSTNKTLAEEVMIRMKTQMLSTAQSIPEVITAMVNQMISQVIQQGVTQMISGGSSGGLNTQGIMNSSASQMQGLIQNGVRQAASPNTFFGR